MKRHTSGCTKKNYFLNAIFSAEFVVIEREKLLNQPLPLLMKYIYPAF